MRKENFVSYKQGLKEAKSAANEAKLSIKQFPKSGIGVIGMFNKDVTKCILEKGMDQLKKDNPAAKRWTTSAFKQSVLKFGDICIDKVQTDYRKDILNASTSVKSFLDKFKKTPEQTDYDTKKSYYANQCKTLSTNLQSSYDNTDWKGIKNYDEAFRNSCLPDESFTEDKVANTFSIDPTKAVPMCESMKGTIVKAFDLITARCPYYDINGLLVMPKPEEGQTKLDSTHSDIKSCVEHYMTKMNERLPFKLDDPEREAIKVHNFICGAAEFTVPTQFKLAE